MREYFLASALCLGTVSSLTGQKIDYHKADLIRTSSNYVFGLGGWGGAYPTFLEDSVRFWYRSSNRADRGTVYLVDPARASKRVLFDNARLASALSLAADTLLDPGKLPMFKVVDTARAVELELRRKGYRCLVATYACTAIDSAEFHTRDVLKNGPSWASRSPDKKWDVFGYGNNLYVRPAAVSDSEAIATRDSAIRARATKDSTKKDTTGAAKDTTKKAKSDSTPLPKSSIQLTTDGTISFSYVPSWFREVKVDTAKPKPMRPTIVWAPNSQRFTVERVDDRSVRVYPMYSSTQAQPVDKSYYWAAPGDSAFPKFDVHVIDVTSRTNVKVKDDPSPQINFSSSATWNRTGDKVFLVNSSRGYKRMRVTVADAATGDIKIITRDSFPTWVEQRGMRVVNGGEDILWVSERDGWSHIYRFGADGTLKNQVESGPYAASLVHVDSVAKHVYFSAGGKEPGNPYYDRLYRVNFDGSGTTLLTPEDANHQIAMVPKGPYFIDTYARPDLAPVTVLRSLATGQVILEMARGDLELLHSIGWSPPEVFQVKARDGVTDLWGLMYKPSHFDPKKQYPIIDHIYPGPQIGSVFSWGFSGQYEARSLAELGFIVIELDHLGTPNRSKAFHDFYFGNMGDNGIPDHIAGIRQLAARYSWIDVNQVGIYGVSGGGFASTDAILRHPDFYKVAVSIAGNHDQRTYGYFWGEKYQGLLTKDASGKDNFEAAANYTLASNLKGKLFLIHGDMDSNVHPAATLRVAHALIQAGKDFDMLIMPDEGHAFPPYAIRRMWDYFVRHLLGVEPPAGYQMIPTVSW